jgi:hypothetical protein
VKQWNAMFVHIFRMSLKVWGQKFPDWYKKMNGMKFCILMWSFIISFLRLIFQLLKHLMYWNVLFEKQVIKKVAKYKHNSIYIRTKHLCTICVTQGVCLTLEMTLWPFKCLKGLQNFNWRVNFFFKWWGFGLVHVVVSKTWSKWPSGFHG